MVSVGAVDVRPFQPADAAALRALAPRLIAGVATWRPPGAVRTAVEAWVDGSIAAAEDTDHVVYVADDHGVVRGFVSVTWTTHWTGDTDAYIGELVVAPGVGRRGIGSALLARAEGWARTRGLTRLQLQTGAANDPALAFYAAHGFEAEDVRLSKPLDPPD